MHDLRKKALTGIARLQVIFGLLLFVPAWTLRFWQAWVYWSIFGVCVLGITLHFLRRDPALIERRLRAGPAAEREKSQKIIQSVASILNFAALVIPGIEHRLHGSRVPTILTLGADAVIIGGFVFVFLTFRENSHASGIIEVQSGQLTISTGPYALVRHPMYAGSLLVFLMTPVALGSYWALLCVPPLAATLVARLLHEETYLLKNLSGYPEYCRKVPFRLVPYLW